MPDESDNQRFWRSFSGAIGTEFRESTSITGASGIEHPVQAIAVDDKLKRVLVVSAEQNPRIAALMQVDVQATMPDARVLVTRPVAFDLAEVTRRVFEAAATGHEFNIQQVATAFANLSNAEGDVERQKEAAKLFQPLLPLFDTSSRLQLPVTSQILGLAQQLINLDWSNNIDPKAPFEGLLRMLSTTIAYDSLESDRTLGVCPMPLYELSESDWELMLSGTRVDEIRVRLKELGIYQYFFPAPEHLLLGIAEQRVTKDGNVVAVAEQAPALGHPIGQPELFQDADTLLDVMDELKSRGYMAEADFGLTITERGRELHQQVRIRPREGLIHKLSRLISVKLDIKFPGG